MSRLTPLRPEEVIRRLRGLGFEGPVSGGRHLRMINPKTRKMIPVPMHGGRDVAVGLIRAIIREVGITREQWSNL
jgi:predicted RNA binding protein YcfA (HicA-like mRNA interferase family)